MVDQPPKSGSQLTDAEPASAAPTSDTAGDAAAWARIDQALRSTRKWLWVFVVVTGAFACGALLVAVQGIVYWFNEPAEARDVFDPLMVVSLGLWGLASAMCAIGMAAQAHALRRSVSFEGYSTLLIVMRSQGRVWRWAAIALAWGAMFFASVGLLVLQNYLRQW
jgi:hypothetical protein